MSGIDFDGIVFGKGGLEECYDRPHIEIAWDQWSRTRIFCKHGVFEGVSDFMDLEQGIDRAMAGFRASLATGVHNCCWEDTPVPASWVIEGSHKPGDVTDCDLVKGHDGDHICWPDDESEDAYWRQRQVYYINGHDVTGKRNTPQPIGAYRA